MNRPKSVRRASDINIIWGRGVDDPDLAFTERSDELVRRGSHSYMAVIDVDKEKEPWQVKQQVWQRPEHARSLFGMLQVSLYSQFLHANASISGLCPALTPAEVRGVPVVRTTIDWMLHCRIIWKISEPPAAALWSTILQAPAPLTREQLDSLAVEPPEPVMHLLFGRWSRDRKEAIITIHGSEAGVTVGNVLSEIYRFVSKRVVFVDDGLVEVASNHSGRKGSMKDITNSDSSVRSSGGKRRSSLAPVEENAGNTKPLWSYMGEPKYLSGIRWDKSLLDRLGEEYWDLKNLWIIDFTSTPPEPFPVQKRRNSEDTRGGPPGLYSFNQNTT